MGLGRTGRLGSVPRCFPPLLLCFQPARDRLGKFAADTGLGREVRPVADGAPHFVKDCARTALAHVGERRQGEDVRFLNAGALAVDGHLMPRRPVPFRIVRKADIVCRRKRPFAAPTLRGLSPATVN